MKVSSQRGGDLLHPLYLFGGEGGRLELQRFPFRDELGVLPEPDLVLPDAISRQDHTERQHGADQCAAVSALDPFAKLKPETERRQPLPGHVDRGPLLTRAEDDRSRGNQMRGDEDDQRRIDPVETTRSLSVPPTQPVLGCTVRQCQNHQPECVSLDGRFGRQQEPGPEQTRE